MRIANLFLLTLIFFCNALKAQYRSYESLDINKMNASFYVPNIAFSDSTTGFVINVEDLPSAVVASSGGLWIGGFDNANALHTAISCGNVSDFFPGPVDTVSYSCDTLTAAAFNRIWKMNKDTIDSFIYEFNSGNVTNGSYPIPVEILSWPGNGLPVHSKELAPYMDLNADGYYNPFDGDYPLIHGDQELFWITNDICSAHPISGGNGIGIEVHASVYGYNCPYNVSVDSLLNHTIFVHYDVYNRGAIDLEETYLGINNFHSLGNSANDYVGYDYGRNTCINYNSTNTDNGATGFGANPPGFNCIQFKGLLADVGDGLDNDHDGIIDEPDETISVSKFLVYEDNGSNTGNPADAQDYYNYLRGIWKDGSPLLFGGSGYQSATNLPCDYMYTGLSDSDNVGAHGIPTPYIWTEQSPQGTGSTPNLAGPRRSVMSMGPFTFFANEKRSFDFAYLFTWYKTLPNGPSTSEYLNNTMIDSLIGMWKTGTFPCLNVPNDISALESKSEISVCPNPAKNEIVIACELKEDNLIRIYDASGKLCKELHVEISTNKSVVDISGLSNGMYLLRLYGNNSNSASVKFSILR